VAVAGTNQLRAVERWFDRGLYIGVDGSYSDDVQAHVRPVTVKEVEEHKGKLEEVRAQEMEGFQEERRERRSQVMLLRKPTPVIAAFLRCTSKE